MIRDNELILYPLFSMPVATIDTDIDNKKVLSFLKKTKLGLTASGMGSHISFSNKVLFQNLQNLIIGVSIILFIIFPLLSMFETVIVSF